MSADDTHLSYTGEEPYRRFGIAVNKAPLVSVEEVARVQGCQALYWQEYKKVGLMWEPKGRLLPDLACCERWSPMLSR